LDDSKNRNAAYKANDDVEPCSERDEKTSFAQWIERDKSASGSFARGATDSGAFAKASLAGGTTLMDWHFGHLAFLPTCCSGTRKVFEQPLHENSTGIGRPLDGDVNYNYQYRLVNSDCNHLPSNNDS